MEKSNGRQENKIYKKLEDSLKQVMEEKKYLKSDEAKF